MMGTRGVGEADSAAEVPHLSLTLCLMRRKTMPPRSHYNPVSRCSRVLRTRMISRETTRNMEKSRLEVEGLRPFK